MVEQASGLENPVVTWLVIIGVISISGLGMYGGRSESALPLKIGLSLGMSISMIRQIQRYDSREPVTFSA
ncbi:hypothetical protein INR49_006268 [Caranx melampygus]|nr:hypothetical protein INR49_006268 [Caranx melampygus]